MCKTHSFNIHAHLPSGARDPNCWSEPSFTSFCMRAVKAQTRLCGCTGLSEPMQFLSDKHQDLVCCGSYFLVIPFVCSLETVILVLCNTHHANLGYISF